MVPSDMDDLQVPGVGSVAETLPCIQHLCNHMKEARPACTRVATRLQNLQQELRRMSEEGHPPALESLAGYVEVFANFLQLLRKYHNKHLIFRVAEHQKMTERLKQVNEQLAQVFAALDVGAPTNWDTSWQIDCRLQEQALTNAVDKSDIRSLQSSRAQLEALLTLKFEVEKRADRHDGMSMILIQSLMGKISAEMKRTEVTLPPWFLPLYEVEVEAEPFAGGHFGKVHRGVMRSGEKVVVEFFSVDELVTDERAQVQVEKELGRLFQLRHSNVVTMLGGSHVSTPPFVVYEDTDNGNLGCFLARSDNKKKIWTMLNEAALGLDYLHKKGFTHGHLKLSNILVGTDGQAKLADVGLNAMRRYSALSKKFPDAVAKDDLRWRAPECLVKGPTTTSDVYAFGMCIVEAVTDAVPFALVDPSNIGETTLEQPDEMNETERQLVLAMTSKDPSERAPLHDVIENLKEFVARAACEEPSSTEQTCVSCSAVVAAGSRFCSQCGTQLPPSTTNQSTPTLCMPGSVYVSKDTTVPALIAVDFILVRIRN